MGISDHSSIYPQSSNVVTSMKQPDASAGLDLRMWRGEGGVSQLHIPMFIPLTLLLPVPPHSFVLCPSSAVSSTPCSPPGAPATSCSFGRLTHTSCCPQPSLLMQLALTQPRVSCREVPPSHMGSQLPRGGDARVALLWLMQFVVFLHCVCKSSPILFQGEGFAPSNMGRKDCACTTATCIRG